ncbi:MAG: hypothetical protein ACLRZ2_01145 [Veillonella sp.]
MEQFNAWVDSIWHHSQIVDALRQWIAETGAKVVAQIDGIKKIKQV